MAAYCRVSSGSEEQLSSFNAQVQYYKKYICENPDYEFAGIFADEGISGTSLKKRDAFNQMMEDAKAGKIDMIVTKSLSRFGRNTLDTLKSIRTLKEIGVDVYFEKENIHTNDKEGELLITLISAVAEQSSQSLSENLKWGIHKQYERGNIKSVGSGKFLGYTKDEEGNLIIDEAEAPIVRRIYKEFLEGYGAHQIANRLIEENVPMTYGGKGWHASHIKKVLKNEKHKGDFLFQKTYNTCYLTKKRAKNNGELPQYYFENTHPAIIDKETWELVQLEFERQEKYKEKYHLEKSRYHNIRDKSPFSKRIICGTCGYTFMQRKSGSGVKVWRCKTFIGKKGSIVEGKMFTPQPRKRWSTNPYKIKRRKDPEPRQMYCTDIKIPVEDMDRAFINAWNYLVDHPEDLHTDTNNDLLTAYRIKEHKHLLGTGKINKINAEIVRRVLDHIVVKDAGEIRVKFLSGVEVRIRR